MLFIVKLALLVTVCHGFNLDPLASMLQQDPRKRTSYFGFTVALQQSPRRLLVGSPRSNSDAYVSIPEPGVTYQCPFDRYGNLLPCQELLLETAGEVRRPDIESWDRKNGSWIGGALDVSSPDHMVACGSRWSNQYHTDFYLMNGVCYAMRSTQTEAQKLVPLLDKSTQSFEVDNEGPIYFNAYGQAGFSAHFTPSLELLLGAPGTLLWTGNVVKYEYSQAKGFINPLIPNPHYTDALPREGYFGYSVTSGQFLKNELLYCASAPRADYYKGSVYLFRFPVAPSKQYDIVHRLNGSQMGEYFGASLCVADVDNDGLDDLLVGAPMHSDSNYFDVGKVYLYLNSRLWKGLSPLELSPSSKQPNRFGTTISALGDINLDGFQDIAVGAPYEGFEGSSGAVYIYLGGATGPRTQPSQIIRASSLRSNVPLRGFGISISRAVDVDGNFYPDIAVGAFESGHVAILKTRPVVKLLSRFQRSIPGINANTSDFNFEVCNTYQGKHVDNINLEMTLNIDNVHRRASFFGQNQILVKQLTLKSGIERCESVRVLLRPQSQWSSASKFASIPINITSQIAANQQCGNKLCPVIDPSFPGSQLIKVPVMALCGKDECVPVWKVSARFQHGTGPLLLGSTDTVQLSVTVWNEGDNAHIQKVNISLPPLVSLRSLPSYCSYGDNQNKLTCLSGYRIDKGAKIPINLSLRISSEYKALELIVNATTHAFDLEVINWSQARLPIVRLLQMEIEGRATPSLQLLQPEAKVKKSVTVSHSYHAYSKGLLPIERVRVVFRIPVSVRLPGVWLQLLTFFVQSSNPNCTIMEEEVVPKLVMDSLHPSKGGIEAKIGVVVCEGGPIRPRSEGLQFTIKMNVSAEILGLFLTRSNVAVLNTSAESSAVGEADILFMRTVSTIFEGPVPVKSDPLIWVYVVCAVIAALLLLLLLAFVLKKVGFFNRIRGEENVEEEAEKLRKEAQSDADTKEDQAVDDNS